MMKTFKNIFDFQAHFNTEEKCREYLELQRWGNTPACPCCGSTNVMPSTQEYYELNYHADNTSVRTAYAIDQSLITAIWIGYPLSDNPTLYGGAIDLSIK